MTFSDFSFNCGPGYAWFSTILANALSKVPQAAMISAPNPLKPWLKWVPNADMLEWDKGYVGMSYGRYLTYTKSPGLDYPFWLGLYFDHEEIRFTIEFDIEDPNIKPKVNTIRNTFPSTQSTLNLSTKKIHGSLYIWLDSANNTNLLDGSHSQMQCEQILQDFIDEVLKML
jgi:hypothetical protein